MMHMRRVVAPVICGQPNASGIVAFIANRPFAKHAVAILKRAAGKLTGWGSMETTLTTLSAQLTKVTKPPCNGLAQ